MKTNGQRIVSINVFMEAGHAETYRGGYFLGNPEQGQPQGKDFGDVQFKIVLLEICSTNPNRVNVYVSQDGTLEKKLLWRSLPLDRCSIEYELKL